MPRITDAGSSAMRVNTFIAILATSMLIAFGAIQTSAQSALPQATFATVGPETRIPYGWVDFCTRRPEECNQGRLAALDVGLTTKAWNTLDRVNRDVNASIQPITNSIIGAQYSIIGTIRSMARAIARSMRCRSVSC